jgi:hypothetical protein
MFAVKSATFFAKILDFIALVPGTAEEIKNIIVSLSNDLAFEVTNVC